MPGGGIGEHEASAVTGDPPGHFGEAAEAGGLSSGLAGPDGDTVAAVRHAISALCTPARTRRSGRGLRPDLVVLR